jgi:glycosyltransferase involved in cell wall biosynthesis
MTATESLRRDLSARGFGPILHWSRGVDLELFHPAQRARPDTSVPGFLYVGRIAVEKNIEAFLALDLPGEKHVVGDGPDLARLKTAFPDARFHGALSGQALARAFASADVFVFPSRTDTFGLVLLEALASGTPVAAYPCMGPIDVVRSPKVGALDDDLRAAVLRALSLNRQDCRAYAENFSWAASARQFADNVHAGVERHRRRQGARQDFRRRTA